MECSVFTGYTCIGNLSSEDPLRIWLFLYCCVLCLIDSQAATLVNERIVDSNAGRCFAKCNGWRLQRYCRWRFAGSSCSKMELLFSLAGLSLSFLSAASKGSKIAVDWWWQKMVQRNMRKELITEEELMTEIWKEGYENLNEIAKAFMEGDGNISIIPKGKSWCLL